MRLPFILVLFITSLPLVTPIATITVFELAGKILEIVSELTEIPTSANHADLIDTAATKREKAVFSKLDYINVQLMEIDEQLHFIGNDVNVILRILNDLPGKIRYELRMNEIRSSQYFLETYYADYEKLIRDMDLYENSTQIEFANGIVSPNPNSVIFLMKILYIQVTSSEFLDLIYEHFAAKEASYFCTVQQSLPETFHNLLNEMVMLNLKSFVMIHSAYTIKKKYKQGIKMLEKDLSRDLRKTGKFRQEIIDANKDFKKRTNGLIAVMKTYMAKASSEMWRCDPIKHVEDETYVQITNFVHGYILNKANIDENGSCRQECDVYSYSYKKGTRNCGGNEWCEKQPLCPKIISCHWADHSMTVCSTDMHTSNKRYEYIQLQSGRVFGKKTSCPKKDQTNLATYRSYLVFKCSYCFCLCDEGAKFFSDRYINLRAVTTNLTDNRVVTGVRFIKHNQIIHLQIQEGRLLTYGQIDLSSLRWVPPDDYTTIDKNVTDGIDFHTLSWEHRGMDLADIKARDGSVVTGVKFTKVGTRLHLEVQSTPFNFTTGQLKTRWAVFELDPNLRFKHKFARKLNVAGTDVPTRAHPPSSEFTTNKFVEFINSDFVRDAGQTTVPFFDAQPATSKKPVPLAGIGVFHKGQSGFGGFITPRIFTYNFTKHLKPVFPRDKEEKKGLRKN